MSCFTIIVMMGLALFGGPVGWIIAVLIGLFLSPKNERWQFGCELFLIIFSIIIALLFFL